MSLRSENGGRLPTTKECIEYIKTTYGGCTYVGTELWARGTGLPQIRMYIFEVPARTWQPITYFTAQELRFIFIHGW